MKHLSSAAIRLSRLLVALALLASALACEDLGTPQPGGPTTRPPDNPNWYHLYFTGPTPDNPTGGIPDEIVASLDAAQKTIDVAIYEFNLPVIADALLQAKARGVRVRLVTDTDLMEEPVYQDLRKGGLQVVAGQPNAIMHNKFVVIDGATLWTGSMNFTENEAYRNNNNYLQIVSPLLAENYTREFEEMFVRGEFGGGSTANTPHPSVTIDGTLIENYFAPEDGVAQRILSQLQSAKSSIYFMAFSFTRTDFADALIAKAQAGVTVQGVFERRQLGSGSDAAWQALTGAGLDVHQDGNRYTQHNKVFIIDEQVVVMGSYNFTKSADRNNDENVLIIHNAAIAQAYTAEWQKVWLLAEK